MFVMFMFEVMMRFMMLWSMDVEWNDFFYWCWDLFDDRELHLLVDWVWFVNWNFNFVWNWLFNCVWYFFDNFIGFGNWIVFVHWVWFVNYTNLYNEKKPI